MFGLLVSIASIECIQRVVQCVQGPPELLWLCHASCQLLDTMTPTVLTTGSQIKYLVPIIVFFSCTFWATICKTIRPMLSDRCPVCLSVCNVGALWPYGWTDQDETWHAGRTRPWPHCVRWNPAPPPPKGHSPTPAFGPYLLQPNGCMDQDATWYGGMPRSAKRLCVIWGPRFPSPKGGRAPPPKSFRPCLLWPNGWMYQDGTWH